MSKFSDLGLSEQILEQINRAGFVQPTPIQEQAIPSALMNRDIVGIAQTGTGKTAAFVLPLLDILTHSRQRPGLPRALLLNPTRELAMQTAEVIDKFSAQSRIKHTLLIGGMTISEQIQQLTKAPDIITATPGRLLDLMQRGKILLNAISVLVIDEADRMLDMGFIPDVEKICSVLPAQRQTILMSATMDAEIGKLVKKFTNSPKHIDLSPQKRSAETIEEKFISVQNENQKISFLIDELKNRSSALIFCNRRQRVKEVARSLTTSQAGEHLAKNVGKLHGEMPQASRIEELEKFRKGVIKFLICSDVAARGLDIEAVDCVVNFDVPVDQDNYVHRIGRTGRAGLKGTAITYVSPEDTLILERNGMLKQVEQALGKQSAPEKYPAQQYEHLENNEGRRGYRQSTERNQSSGRYQSQGEDKGRGRYQSQDRDQDRGRYQSQDRDQGRDRYQSQDRDQDRGRYQSQDRDQGRDRYQSSDRNQSQDRYQSSDRNQSQVEDKDRNQSRGGSRGRDRYQSQGEDKDRYQSQDRYQSSDRNQSQGEDKDRYQSQDRYQSSDRNQSQDKDQGRSREQSRGRGRGNDSPSRIQKANKPAMQDDTLPAFLRNPL